MSVLLWSGTETQLVSKDIHCNLRTFVVQIKSCTEEFIQEEVADSPSSPLEKECVRSFHVQGHVTTAVEGN